MTREQLREYCDAYALGALDGAGRAELEARIQSGDAECLAQLRESEALAAQLAFSAPLGEPRPLVRSRVLNEMRASAPRPAAKRNWMAVAGWAVAAGLAVAGYFGMEESRRAANELAAARTEILSLRDEAVRGRKVVAALMARDARIIRLASEGPEAPVFRAVWSRPGGLVLAGLNIPAPALGRTMQLWVVPKKGNPISAGVFRPSATGEVVLFAANIAAVPEDAAALAVSDEPEGGSPQPTTKPAWVGPIGD